MTSRIISFLAATLFLCSASADAHAEVSEEILGSITTPNEVDTSIGTLEFLDGAPTADTAQKAYDYLDRMRGVDAFLKGMPGASLQGLIKGAHSIGAVECHQVLIPVGCRSSAARSAAPRIVPVHWSDGVAAWGGTCNRESS